MTTEDLIPAYLDARAERVRDAVEAVGGRIVRRQKNEVVFVVPVDSEPLRGIIGTPIVGERGSGRIILDPAKAA